MICLYIKSRPFWHYYWNIRLARFEPVFKIKKLGKSRPNESTLFNRIHGCSFRVLGQRHRLFCGSTPFPEPVFKIKKCWIESTQWVFLTVFMNTVLEYWGSGTNFLRFDSLSWGDGEGEGCCRLFQRINWGSLVFFVMPPVYRRCKRNSLKHNHVKNGWEKNIYSIIFYSILFYSILFYSIPSILL